MSDGMIDGGLDAIAACTVMNICSAEPTSIAECASLSLADVVLDSGDFTKAAGDTSGRKVTVAQQTDVPIDSSGTATHVAINDGTDFHVTTCTSQALTSGGTVTVPSYDHEIADPT